MWIWVVLGLAIIALAIGGYLWWRRRQQHARATSAWHNELATTTADLNAARDLLRDAAGGPIEPDRLEMLRHHAETAAVALGRLSTTAPNDDARARTDNAEQALRGYMLAIAAEQLLRTQTLPAPEDALADANVTRRARAEGLDDAISELEALERNATAHSTNGA